MCRGDTLRLNDLAKRSISLLGVAAAVFLSGCAGPVYTTDDGSPVDEKLLANIRLYGKGEQTIRPSIVKTAQLKDEDCSTQWELPFVVATSYDLPKQEKIAWVRGLQVDERLTIIAAAEESGLKPGDKIAELDGNDDDADDLYEELMELREDGDEFKIVLSDGRKFQITPVEVCRGRVEITKPYTPNAQDYHWLKSTHPMSLFGHDLTPDEAMWVVLWTQGLSEEAGMRMKTYHYGMKFVKTTITVASIVSGVGAAANAASAAAANIAASEAGKAAAQAAGKEVASYVAEQVADSVRKAMVEAALKEVAKEAAKAAAQEMAAAAVVNAGLFKSSLSGISWVAGTGFYMADKWALDRMQAMGANPIAAYTLHFKLAAKGQADNAFVFDEERLANMITYAEDHGFGVNALLALEGAYWDPTLAKAEQVQQSVPEAAAVETVEAIPFAEFEILSTNTETAAVPAPKLLADVSATAPEPAAAAEPTQLTVQD